MFNSEPLINTEQLITLIQTQAQCYKFDGKDKLRFNREFDGIEEKLDFLDQLLDKLSV